MEVRNVDQLIRFSDDKIQKIPLFDSPKYFCDLYCLKPGQDQRIHTHEESEKIYFVMRGTGLFHIGGGEREVERGQAGIARTGEAYSARNARSEDLPPLVFKHSSP